MSGDLENTQGPIPTPKPTSGIPAAGEVIKDYRIERQLGEGGMALVFVALHSKLRKRFALKMLSPALSADRTLVSRFHAEALVLARLKHTHIVSVSDVFEDNGRYFLVMEFVEGGSLEDVRRASGWGPIPLTKLAPWLSQILQGMDYLHSEGVIHRDLKPSNLLIEKNGEIKIADFGIAEVVGPLFEHTVFGKDPVQSEATETRIESSSVNVGTTDYLAPEIRLGKEADRRSDIFSFGVIAYVLLTGKKPIGAVKLPSALVPGIGKAWDRFILKCLEHEPAQRFSSAAEALEVYAGILSRTSALRPKVHPMRWVALVGGCATLLLVSLVFRNGREVSPARLEGDPPVTILIAPQSPAVSTQPAQAIPLATHGSVRFKDLPPGAEIFSDGIRSVADETGMASIDLPIGLRRIEINAKGYQPWKANVPITATNLEQTPALELWPFRPVQITGLPPSATVRSGENTAIADKSGIATLMIRPGEASIEAAAPRYFTRKQDFTVLPEQKTLEIILEKIPPPGEFIFEIKPGISLRAKRVEPGRLASAKTPGVAHRPSAENDQVIEHPFYMGVQEVTQAEFEAVTGKNPSYNRSPRNGNLPVEQVGWQMLTSKGGFLEMLNALLEEKSAPYRADLPNELEWEYVAQVQVHESEKEKINHNSFNGPLPVAEQEKNSLEFYGLHGNVAEWTRGVESDRPVLRGGHWRSPPQNVGSQARREWAPFARGDDTMGLRVVFRPKEE